MPEQPEASPPPPTFGSARMRRAETKGPGICLPDVTVQIQDLTSLCVPANDNM